MGNHPQKTDGLGYFNLARGLGIVLILIGHSINPFLTKSADYDPFQGAGSILGSGVLAAFFMISGFGFYKRTPKKCLSIQKKLLLRPYCLVAVAVLGTKVLLALLEQRSFWQHGGELVLTYLFGLNAEGGGSVLGIPIESISIFWFVLALFGGWMVYNAMMQLKSARVRHCLVAGCVILSYLLTLVSKVWPFCLPMALLAVGYLAVGDAIRKHHLLERQLPIWSWGLLFLIVLLSAAFGEVNIVACVWRLGLIDVAGSFCTGFLLLRLYARLMEREWQGKVVGVLEEIGFHSIWIVCLHAYEKIIFPWYRVCGLFRAQPWIGVCICFFGRCAVMYLIYRIVSYFSRKWKKKHRKKKITIEL